MALPAGRCRAARPHPQRRAGPQAAEPHAAGAGAGSLAHDSAAGAEGPEGRGTHLRQARLGHVRHREMTPRLVAQPGSADAWFRSVLSLFHPACWAACHMSSARGPTGRRAGVSASRALGKGFHGPLAEPQAREPFRAFSHRCSELLPCSASPADYCVSGVSAGRAACPVCGDCMVTRDAGTGPCSLLYSGAWLMTCAPLIDGSVSTSGQAPHAPSACSATCTHSRIPSAW